MGRIWYGACIIHFLITQLLPIQPDVHYACGIQTKQCNHKLGSFDLRDASSALHLAQFILGLGPHYNAVATQSKRSPPRSSTSNWRADGAADDKPLIPMPKKIEQWSREVAKYPMRLKSISEWDDNAVSEFEVEQDQARPAFSAPNSDLTR